ncbi:MAG TPA: hypothetical protein VGC39_01335 [Candidatus Methylacidiphilales bacterium]
MKRIGLAQVKINVRIIALGLCFSCAPFAALSAQGLAPSAPPAKAPATDSQAALTAAFQDLSRNDMDGALAKVNQILQLDPQNKQALLLRAGLYAQQKKWDDADHDYQIILVMEPDSTIVKFDVADLKFLQKKYDDARRGFADLEHDKSLGDLAVYKAFLCDLFGGHEDVAASDLQALDQVGGNPSYYFGNAAWDIAHHKNEDAAGWLKSAAYIYEKAPQKFSQYAASLTSVGYLPLPPTTPRN